MNKIDMTGWIMKEHGVPDSKLTILYELPERKNKRIIWHCKCECGNECDINGIEIRSGHNKSCGCMQGKSESKIINLLGQKFGKLTVIERVSNDQNRHVRWKCKCDCGNEVIIRGYSLINGTKSCGCLQKEKMQERRLDLTNQKFGKLTAIKPIHLQSTGVAGWLCQCECGNIIEVSTHCLKSQFSCGCIKSKGEEKITQILFKNHILFKKEKRFDNCRFKDTNELAKFDFYINNQYIIEYDGKQHFTTKNAGWGESLESIQKRDKIKNQYCFEHNIPIIRIPYTHYDNICLEDLIPETSQFLLKQEE
jgi:hypothetical protein